MYRVVKEAMGGTIAELAVGPDIQLHFDWSNPGLDIVRVTRQRLSTPCLPERSSHRPLVHANRPPGSQRIEKQPKVSG
jgi:hypothetical protein